MIKKQIDEKGVLWASDTKPKIEVEITCEIPDPMMCDGDYETYESFSSLMELFSWIAENIDFLKKAEDSGYEIRIFFKGEDKGNRYEWAFDTDSGGLVRLSIEVGGLIGDEHRRCLEKLRKIEEALRE